MKLKPTLGTILTLVGIIGLVFAVIGQITSYISRSAFTGVTILGCIIFFAGVTLLRDQLEHK
ncbi:hypothetical protein HK413_07890 [Mucilaginibacter sp. S1162]|uniref:Phosphatidate cytidylyltransferase n=1 Tax=Mucilaginibacter humi TaxID=2732510 RepID=A0ABX1W721_9SPHI|nr:hypothetical protein [Mucilaginibacter humi]NNU34087.1 hypothetical protein [Mucilaginibacter humi]